MNDGGNHEENYKSLIEAIKKPPKPIKNKTTQSKSINYDLLQKEIRKPMQRWHKLYKFLKEELTLLGYWQNKPRGNPKLGYKKGFGKGREE